MQTVKDECLLRERGYQSSKLSISICRWEEANSFLTLDWLIEGVRFGRKLNQKPGPLGRKADRFYTTKQKQPGSKQSTHPFGRRATPRCDARISKQ